MSEGFTSRRGKYTTVVAEELQRIDAATQPTTTPARKRTVLNSHPKRKFPKIKIKIKLSARAWRVIAFVVIIVILAAWLSADSVKRDYERQAATMSRSIADAGTQLPSDSASAVSVADRLLGALHASSDCRVSGIDVISWYGPAKTARQQCQATAERYARLKAAITRLKSIASYADTIRSALGPALALPADGGYAIISDYAAAWKKACEDIDAIASDTVLRDLHASLRAKAHAVRDAWTVLDAANTARDKSAFQAAESALSSAYNEFRGVADQLHAHLQTEQSAITQASATPI